jgi:hypothetical protein
MANKWIGSTCGDLKVVSFSIKVDLYRRLKAKLPRHGQMSRLVARLLEAYLAGKIVLQEDK